MCGLTLIIPALSRLKQEDSHELEVNLNSQWDPVFKRRVGWRWRENESVKQEEQRGGSGPAAHSRCSILTFGGRRTVRFFFSFFPFVFAWKFRQLSTRPSRLS